MQDLHYQDGEDRLSKSFNPSPNGVSQGKDDTSSALPTPPYILAIDPLPGDNYIAVYNPLTQQYETKNVGSNYPRDANGYCWEDMGTTQEGQPLPVTPPKDKEWFDRELKKHTGGYADVPALGKGLQILEPSYVKSDRDRVDDLGNREAPGETNFKAPPSPNDFDKTIKNFDHFRDYYLVIRAAHPWYKRLWTLISNPFLYIFKGYWRI